MIITQAVEEDVDKQEDVGKEGGKGDHNVKREIIDKKVKMIRIVVI